MNTALWLLIGLQMRGWLRYLLRSLRTLKGALLALVGLAVFVPWLLAVVLTPRPGDGVFGHGLRDAGPALLLLYCFMNVVFSSGERAIYFPPAEVNFLFPGPFSRRELLGYKIVSTLIIGLPTALFMSLMLRGYSSWFVASFAGMLLIVLFMQLFSMTINLLAISVGARLYTRGRKLTAALAVLLGAAVLLQVGGSPRQWQPEEMFNKLLDAPAWKNVSWPLRSFFDAVAAERLWPDLVQSAALGALVNLFLAGVIFALDAQYLEAAAAASARIYARMQRLRRGGMGSGEGLRRGGTARISLPMLPWLGGIGPIGWRQLTTAARGADRLLLLLVILGVALGAPMLATLRDEQENVLLVLAPVALWLTLFMTTLLPFDFRGDIDRLALLKTLPLPAWRLAIGQLLAPVLLMTTLQGIGLAVVAWTSPPSDWLLPACLVCAAYVPPINFLLFALDNLLFLLFPTRLMAATPGDFQALGRSVLFLAAKVTALGIVCGVAVIVGAVMYVASDESLLLAALAAWPVVVLSAAALVPLVAWAFTIFDVGRNTPV
ncbi:MAG TPA: putative ABC exporter domain-containing protein [Gemmataceae bacterium]|nr:putative ABC exporter domain-containing protein [Gemmataceae bacterium]